MIMTESIPQSPLNQIFTVCKYELLMEFRKKKIFAILAIAVAISVLLISLLEYLESLGLLDQAIFTLPLGFAPLLAILLGAFFGSNSLVSEFSEKTGNTLFPNPISRTSVWFGKFLSTEVISVGVISLYYVITISYALTASYAIPPEVLLSFSFTFVSVTMVLSIAFLISSIFKGPTGATVLVFLLFIVIFPIIDQIFGTVYENKPWFSPTFSNGIILYSLTVPYPTDGFQGSRMGQMGTYQFVPEINDSLLVMLAYIVGASVSSIIIFKHRDMK